MKITVSQLEHMTKSFLGLITESDEERMAKLSVDVQKNNIEDLINKSRKNLKDLEKKPNKELKLTLDSGAEGTIQLFDPNKELYKIKIDDSKANPSAEPRSVKVARLEYDQLEKNLRMKGRSVSEYESEFFTRIINPEEPTKNLQIVPAVKQGVPNISIKKSF